MKLESLCYRTTLIASVCVMLRLG